MLAPPDSDTIVPFHPALQAVLNFPYKAAAGFVVGPPHLGMSALEHGLTI